MHERGRSARTALLALAWVASSLAASDREQAVSIEVSGGRLHGTLLIPDAPGSHPVALIIAGSGPTDRNGNSPLIPGRNDSLKLLAEALNAGGIATLRYDKRGIAGSRGAAAAEADLRFGMYLDDAEAWGRFLRGQKQPFSRVALVGHSEGSLIGMVAAQRLDADRLVSIAGAGRPAQVVIREQLAARLPAELLREADRVLAQLVAGNAVDEPPKELLSLFRPSLQPYMISWLKFDPAREIAAATMPVLIIQGTRDIQVSVADARALARAQPRARLELIPDMNHVLKIVGDDPQSINAGYTDPTLPDAARLVEQVSEFIRAN